MAERSNAADCKSAALGLRGFESLPAHREKTAPNMGLFLLEGGTLELILDILCVFVIIYIEVKHNV